MNEVHQQAIWYNSHILIDREPFCFKKAFDAGMIFINDIINENGVFLKYKEIVDKFGLCISWLQYNQILSAIPAEWSQACINNNRIFTLYNFDRLLGFNKISSIVYDEFIKNDQALMSRKNRWELKLHIIMDIKQFQKIFANIYKQTICTKYRDFQYRVLTDTIPTQKLLNKWKKVDSDICNLCGMFPQDQLHLFCNCIKVRCLWESVKMYIRQNDQNGVSQNINFSERNSVFSSVHPDPNNVTNFLVTITKQYIFRVKCMDGVLLEDQLLQEFEKVYDIEANIATRKNKWNRHVKKWSCIKEIYFQEDNFAEQYLNDI